MFIDASDVLSSQQLGPGSVRGGHPNAHVIPMDEATAVHAGFRDCFEEAIRYLVDVEHLSEDDPLVIGLKQHLTDRQEHLDVDNLVSSSMCVSETPIDGHSLLNVSEAADIWQQGQATATDTHTQRQCGDSHSNFSHITGGVSAGVGSAATPQTLINIESGSSGMGSTDDITETVLNQAMFAPDSHAIASLTQEILSLLAAEDSEFLESDSDGETDQLLYD